MVPLLDFLQQFQAVHPRTLQPDIEQHQRGPTRIDRAKRCIAIGGRSRLISFVFQHARDEIANVFFIIDNRSEEHTSELQSLMRISYAVFCLKKTKSNITIKEHTSIITQNTN